ncbi:MAG: hypothetical protein KGL35_28810 [Bradyrhizobium sp.]|nr:hypothetical protein [Bradyrhizobium sp.]
MIDATEVQKLAGRYMGVGMVYYDEAGLNREALLVQLNALAYTVATILIGTKGEALPFFDTALKQAIADIAKIRKPDHVAQKKRQRRKRVHRTRH